MRGYSVAAAALALQVPTKWLDNLLSQHRVPGVAQSKQGVARRLSAESLWLIATVWQLNVALAIPVAAALRLARELWREAADGEEPQPRAITLGQLTLTLDGVAVRAQVEAALAEALEIAPRTRRGRPREKRTSQV